ncbi:hypothetical protein MMC30_007162 [Trapelia coarctata]|nr:hypothetical protein [Trapelia coarctata]
MTDTVARVETIFRKSRGDCLGHGSSGVVFTVNANIVVKTACRYDIHPPGYAEEEQYSLKRIEEESAVFDILAEPENWHPNIVLSFLHTSDYIFMERANEDLSDYVTRNSPIGTCTTYRFLREIIYAVSWLEQMGILHGDVRPPNILIDRQGHIKLCDFDNVCSFGHYIQVGNSPYYERSDTGSFGIAGAGSEQGAIGCCAYFISTGSEPQSRLHATSHIPVFGAFIQKCWNGQYQPVTELGDDLLAGINQQEPAFCQTVSDRGSLMTIDDYQDRVAECKDYLSFNGLAIHTTQADRLTSHPNKLSTDDSNYPSPLHSNPMGNDRKIGIQT